MKYFTVIVISLCIGHSAIAQKINKSDVPAGVMKTFAAKMTDSVQVNWEKKDACYIARFTKNDLRANMKISEMAEWVMTLWDIPVEYLPKKLKAYVGEKYPGYKTASARLEYKPGAENYLVALKKKKDLPVLRFTVKSEFVGIEPPVIPDNAKVKTEKSSKTEKK